MSKKIYEKYRDLEKRLKTLEYIKWCSMRDRCKIEGNVQKRLPSYIGCTMADCFKSKDEGFQYFAEWCQSQIGFGKDGFQLDKDILVKGNQIYSPDTCVFVPQQLNNLFLLPNKTNNLPVGVRLASNGKYRVELSVNNEKLNLGYFTNSQEAGDIYLSRKIQAIHQIAQQYKDQIDTKLYDVLMNYDTAKLKDYYEIIRARRFLF